MKPPRPTRESASATVEVVEGFGAGGIGHELLEGEAIGQVRLLPGEEHPRALRQRDAAPAIGPEPATAFSSELLPQPFGPRR